MLILFVAPYFSLCSAQDTQQNFSATATRLLTRLDRESDVYMYGRVSIARWYCEQGKYQEAADQGSTLQLFDRLQLLSYIAKTAIERKDKQAAEKILSNAWSLLADGSEEDTQHLAELAAVNQNFDLAEKFVSRLDAGSLKRSRALLSIARSFSPGQNDKEVRGLVESALKQIDGFDEAECKDELQIKISAAGLFARIGDEKRASELASAIHATLLPESDANSADQVALANLFGDLGDLPRAIGIVESMSTDERVDGMMSLSLHCKIDDIRGSLLDKARDRLITHEEDEHSNSIALSNLVSVYLKVGRLDEAVELLRNIDDPYNLHRAAIAVTEKLSDERRTDDAELALNIASDACRKIVSEKSDDIPSYASGSEAKTKSQVLSTLVNSYIKLDKLKGAEIAAKAIDHPQYRAAALAEVGKAYAARGDASVAHRLITTALSISSSAEQYNHDLPREAGLFKVVMLMAEAGLRNEASSGLARLLKELKKNESIDQYAGDLFVLAQVMESREIVQTTSIKALLKQLEIQQNDGN